MAKKPQPRKSASQMPTPAREDRPATPEVAGPSRQDLVTMEEAIASLKTTRPSFYRWLREGKIKGFKIGRQWRFERQDIERFTRGLQPRIEASVSPSPLVRQLEARLSSIGKAIKNGRFPDDPVADAVYLMITLAYHQRASDIHITPQYESGQWSAVLRNRIDGVLHVQATADIRLLPALMERWKTLAGTNLSDKHLPQDGRLSVSIEGKNCDIRVSTLPAEGGESLTARLLAHAEEINFDLASHGFVQEDLLRIQQAIAEPRGMVICNGPTGCGKTTTLYGCLTSLARADFKCISIEDPVEYVLPWVTQVAANPQVGLGFARAIRAFLRSDPDIILVGEIRDLEILETCIQAAMAGHMVLTTLHATDSASALRRMVEIGVKPFMVGDTVRLIISQRLVRKLCRKCSKPVSLNAEEEAAMVQAAVGGGLSLAPLKREFREGVGCAECAGTGYRGRIVVAETLKVTGTIAKALRDDAGVEDLRRRAVAEGMTTMKADGIRKAAQGLTSLREVQYVCGV